MVGHALAGSSWGDAGVQQAVIGETTVTVGEIIWRENTLVGGGSDCPRLQGRELALLRPAMTLLQAERAGADGIRIQLEGR